MKLVVFLAHQTVNNVNITQLLTQLNVHYVQITTSCHHILVY
jgi:hypothetical protein